MNRLKGIPYGISDFNRLRNDNFYFVDKTIYLPLIERMPSYLSLTRPRRFGKSLFLSMMRTYMTSCSGTTSTGISVICGLALIPLIRETTIRYFISISRKPVVLFREMA